MIRVNDENMVECPLCSEPGVHLDFVAISARHEDSVENTIGVDAVESVITIGVDVPRGDVAGEGRRHRIVLRGNCDVCGEHFDYIFTQHKGTTYVEVQLTGRM